MKRDKSEKPDNLFINLVTGMAAVAIVATVVVTALYVMKFDGGLSSSLEHWGQTGDYFGGILNPIFGFLTVFILLVTLLLTRKSLDRSKEELELTRETLELSKQELEQTRKSIEQSTEALENQIKYISRQTFEGSFFQLIKLHNDIVAGITTLFAEHMHQGRQAIVVEYEKFKRGIPPQMMHDKRVTVEVAIEQAESFFTNRLSTLRPYFDNISNILSFLNSTFHDITDIKLYIKILKSQLLPAEQKLIMYYCMTHYGQNLKCLVEQYGLLSEITESDMIDARHKSFFEATAFGDNI